MRFVLGCFTLHILLIHLEGSARPLVEFWISRILRTAFFVIKKGTVPPLLWQFNFREMCHVCVLPWDCALVVPDC